MKHFLSCFLLSVWIFAMLTVCAAAQQEEEPVVVRVGTRVYRQSEVQLYFDQTVSLFEQSGAELTASDAATLRDSVITSFVAAGVMENKFNEFGLGVLTDEDNARIDELADAVYAQARAVFVAQIMEQYGKTEQEADRYADMFMELNGYTQGYARGQALASFKEEKLLDYVAGDLKPLTDAELNAYYQENLVEPSRELYANDVAAFETEVLYGGQMSCYIPEGYRYIRQLMLPAPADIAQKLTDNQTAREEADARITTAANRLYGLKALAEDTTEADAEFTAAQEEYEALEQEHEALIAQMLESYSADITAIREALAQGQSFAEIAVRYADADDEIPEEGYLICKDSILYAEEFRDRAMALEHIGDVSEPFATSLGIHIVEYAGDAKAGAVALTGEQREAVAEAALLAEKYQLLQDRLKIWQKDYEIETNPELIALPEDLT